ncbi:hypothetical protein F4806DRAFT_465883 [Annulohypoxylon nitens]|nr:hypothetical protein F4806DRAFT_465883 [Annulohypoxylon nitens]
MKECFGWSKIYGTDIYGWLRKLWPTPVKIPKIGYRGLSDEKEYICMISEYIPEGENLEATVQLAVYFYWRVGFVLAENSRAENWTSGCLFDFSDIMHINSLGWEKYLPI